MASINRSTRLNMAEFNWAKRGRESIKKYQMEKHFSIQSLAWVVNLCHARLLYRQKKTKRININIYIFFVFFCSKSLRLGSSVFDWHANGILDRSSPSIDTAYIFIYELKAELYRMESDAHYMYTTGTHTQR